MNSSGSRSGSTFYLHGIEMARGGLWPLPLNFMSNVCRSFLIERLLVGYCASQSSIKSGEGHPPISPLTSPCAYVSFSLIAETTGAAAGLAMQESRNFDFRLRNHCRVASHRDPASSQWLVDTGQRHKGTLRFDPRSPALKTMVRHHGP